MNISRLSCRPALNEALVNNTELTRLFTWMHYWLICVEWKKRERDNDMDLNPKWRHAFM